MKKKNTARKGSSRFSDHVADQIGNIANQNLQSGTNVIIDRVRDLIWKVERLSRVGYEQAKGNLFEYIEALKLERNAANEGHGRYDKPTVTDLPESRGGYGNPTGPADQILMKGGQITREVQDKVNNRSYDTAINFLKPKYDGMQRVTTSDTYDDVICELDKMQEKGEISKNIHDEVIANIRKSLTDDSTGISSEGTTTQELQLFRSEDGGINVEAGVGYAVHLGAEQIAHELVGAVGRGALARIFSGSVITAIQEIIDVYKGRKTIAEAIRNIKKAAAKGAKSGVVVGGTASTIRVISQANSVRFLSDGIVSTVLASAMFDCVVMVYDYKKGKISAKELKQNIKRILFSSSMAGSLSFTTRVALGTTGGVFLPMVVYALTSALFQMTMNAMKQANLEAKEYERLTAQLKEENALLAEYGEKLAAKFKSYRDKQKKLMDEFIRDFDQNAIESSNYEGIIDSMNKLAMNMGIPLQHKDPVKFGKAMNDPDETFQLGKTFR